MALNLILKSLKKKKILFLVLGIISVLLLIAVSIFYYFKQAGKAIEAGVDTKNLIELLKYSFKQPLYWIVAVLAASFTGGGIISFYLFAYYKRKCDDLEYEIMMLNKKENEKTEG